MRCTVYTSYMTLWPVATTHERSPGSVLARGRETGGSRIECWSGPATFALASRRRTNSTYCMHQLVCVFFCMHHGSRMHGNRHPATAPPSPHHFRRRLRRFHRRPPQPPALATTLPSLLCFGHSMHELGGIVTRGIVTRGIVTVTLPANCTEHARREEAPLVGVEHAGPHGPVESLQCRRRRALRRAVCQAPGIGPMNQMSRARAWCMARAPCAPCGPQSIASSAAQTTYHTTF